MKPRALMTTTVLAGILMPCIGLGGGTGDVLEGLRFGINFVFKLGLLVIKLDLQVFLTLRYLTSLCVSPRYPLHNNVRQHVRYLWFVVGHVLILVWIVGHAGPYC